MGPVTAETWCPRCRRPVGDAERCPACGTLQSGEAAARLRQVVWRLYAIDEEHRRLGAEALSLQHEQAQLLRALSPEPGREPVPGAPAPESRPEVVRDVLLWLGAALVAVAAVIFALVAWRRLGDAGRAGLLFAATLLAAAASAAAHRRLPATAEALAGLTLALVLVDWYVLRRAGVGAAWSGAAWWSLGTGLAAALAVGTARWLRLQATAAAFLGQVSAVLAIAVWCDAGWTIALGLSAVAVVAAAGAGRLVTERRWVHAGATLAVGASGMTSVALGYVAVSSRLGDGVTSTRSAAVLTVLAIAPALARLTISPRVRQNVLDGLVAASGAFVLGALTSMMAAAASSADALLAGVALLGTAAVGLSRVLPRALSRGSAVAAGATLGVALLGLSGAVLQAVTVPLSWASEPWGTTLGADAAANLGPMAPEPDPPFAAASVALLALAGAAVLAVLAIGGRRLVNPPAAWATGFGAAAGLVATAPLAVGGPVWAAALVTSAGALAAMGGATAAARSRHRPVGAALVVAAAVVGSTAVGWALATEVGTIAFLAAVIAVAGAATSAAPAGRLRGGLGAVAAAALVAESAAVAASAGAATAMVGVAITLVSGFVVAAGAVGRHGWPEGLAAEVVGGGGLVLGASLATVQEPWLAVSLTSAVPWLLVAALRPARRFYVWAGASTAVAATWAWLAAADVTLLEAYTVPAAIVALVAGAQARRRMPGLSSWPSFGPGLTVGLLPSLGLVLARGGLARPLALSAAALAVLLAGARERLQAPLVLGGTVLLAVGLDALWPIARELPRWATIGAVGLLLLWLGATAERRMGQLRDVGRLFRQLEPDGPLGSQS